MLTVEPAGLEGLLVVTPQVFTDERGFFFESYNHDKYSAAGITVPFVQDNHSRSARNTVRGLHFQSDPGQAKLVRVVRGAIFDVAVDIRPASGTCGQWFGIELSADTHTQLFVPVGFAHGFCVLSETAEVLYKCSSLYNPDAERTLAWDDPDVGVAWPTREPILSARDRSGQSFSSYLADRK